MSDLDGPFVALINEQIEAVKRAEVLFTQPEKEIINWPLLRKWIASTVIPLLEGWKPRLQETSNMQYGIGAIISSLKSATRNFRLLSEITWWDPVALQRRFKNLILWLLIVGINFVKLLIRILFFVIVIGILIAIVVAVIVIALNLISIIIQAVGNMTRNLFR